MGARERVKEGVKVKGLGGGKAESPSKIEDSRGLAQTERTGWNKQDHTISSGILDRLFCGLPVSPTQMAATKPNAYLILALSGSPLPSNRPPHAISIHSQFPSI